MHKSQVPISETASPQGSDFRSDQIGPSDPGTRRGRPPIPRGRPTPLEGFGDSATRQCFGPQAGEGSLQCSGSVSRIKANPLSSLRLMSIFAKRPSFWPTQSQTSACGHESYPDSHRALSRADPDGGDTATFTRGAISRCRSNSAAISSCWFATWKETPSAQPW